MDSNSIAILQDYQSSVDISFKKMDKTSKEFEGADTSQQNLAINSLKKEAATVKTNIGLMKMELSNLKEESNVNQWQETITNLQSKYDTFKSKITQMENQKNNVIDPSLQVDSGVDVKKLTSQQAMQYGDNILASDRNAITNMKKVVSQDLNTMQEVNRELLSQNEKLENAENDLKEIDYSLNRAGQQIKTMAKMYATDKLVLFMIFMIILIIVAILIFSAIWGGDDDTNSKTDTFNNGDNAGYYFGGFNVLNILILCLCACLM